MYVAVLNNGFLRIPVQIFSPIPHAEFSIYLIVDLGSSGLKLASGRGNEWI